ncbi:MAG: hypothetical protein ACAH88_11640, partial [Roseimicrobium sp.]
MLRLALPALALLCLPAILPAEDAAPAGNDEVKKIMTEFQGRGTLRDDTPPKTPQEALKTFQMR